VPENRKLDTLLTERNVDHLYFETDESHYPMSRSSTMRMFKFFSDKFAENGH
jgi:hypothetical protein